MLKRMAQKLEPIADDYGHRYDDDTSCYLLENIKFKLNYIRNYSGGDGKWELKSTKHIKTESTKQPTN